MFWTNILIKTYLAAVAVIIYVISYKLITIVVIIFHLCNINRFTSI